jgi:hypothetical protein
MPERRKGPRDSAQLAKFVIDTATGEVEDSQPQGKAPNRVKGGAARTKYLDPQLRREIAQKAASARWAKKRS